MFIIFMGVSGCGKTTIGKKTADLFGVAYYEGDDYHPPENVEKMSQGIPLSDEDREGWLETLSKLIKEKLDVGESGVLSCSALKETYREKLRVNSELVRFVYLKGTYDLIRSRMKARTGHYMPADLLKSQFEALEEPKDVFTVDVGKDPNDILYEVVAYLITIGFTTSQVKS